jgi:hypothetical protein
MMVALAAGESDAVRLVRSQMLDPATHWNMGTFGAIAEFMRNPSEPFRLEDTEEAIAVVTDRGGISVRSRPDMRLIACESTTRESWSHGVALCLPAQGSGMTRHKVFTELGADSGSLRQEDRDAVLFDLGLDVQQVDVCVRTSDKALIAKLREGVGRAVFAHDNPAMGAILAASPHRVFLTGLGRIEVYQAIPVANGKSPDGPHTHVLPKLLQHKRTHAATEPIPEGWVPCAQFHPSHPVKDGSGALRPFHAESHAAFEAMLHAFGDAQSVALKRQIRAAVKEHKEPSDICHYDGRFARTTIRVTLRQLAASNTHSPALPVWLAAYDRARENPDEPGEPTSIETHSDL